LTPTLFGPNSSEVIETAAAKMNPELNPTNAVLICNATALPDAASKKKAIGVGTRAMVSHAVLAKYIFLQKTSLLFSYT
jgi:hypothetical protein